MITLTAGIVHQSRIELLIPETIDERTYRSGENVERQKIKVTHNEKQIDVPHLKDPRFYKGANGLQCAEEEL